jgi:hypothetical protein
MSIAQHIPDNLKRVSRSIGYAAWLDTSDDWHGLPVILRARLDARQRAALAFMALKSLDRVDAVQVAESALAEGAGQPIAPLFNAMDEAAFWADMAAPDELEAYCLASFNAMPAPRKAAFLDFVQGRKVA